MANGTIAFDTLQTSGQITGTAKSVDTDYVVNGSAKSWNSASNAAVTEESFNQGFQSSFISSCIEPYERHDNKKEISRIKFLNYCECTLEEMNKNGDFQLSSIMPRKFQEITDYCFQRELIPLK